MTTLTVQQAELSKLDEPTDVAALMEVIARIRKAATSVTWTETSRKLADLDAELTGQLATLGLTKADSRAVDAIAVPSVELIRRTVTTPTPAVPR